MSDARARRGISEGETGTPDGFFAAPFGSHRPTALQSLLIGLARRTFLHRGKMRHKMTNLIASMGAPLDVTRNGCAYRIEGANNLIEYGLLLHPGYNGPEIDFLCAGLGPDTAAVDIGCNVGLYALPMARAGAQVVAVDANPSMTARLSFNAEASGLPDVQAVHAAVGDGDGMVHLQIRNSDVAIVNVVEDAGGTVPLRRLADILAEAGLTRLDALKIDIEGHEELALPPFLASAPEEMIPDRIVIERAGPEDYPLCVREFNRLGYELVGQTKSNSMYLRTPRKG